jgi:hypothetical protein
VKCNLNQFFSLEKVERNHRMDFIERMNALQNGLNHGLSKDNLRKFQIKLKFCQLFWMKFYNYSAILLTILTVATIHLILYISQDYNFYLITLLLFFVLITYIAIEMMVTYGQRGFRVFRGS